jgi:tetratricopeptide (TPR) repeat protein
MALHVAKSFHELMTEAKEAEAEDPLNAAKLYERAIKMEPHDQLAYDRLMIIYRKQKMYKEELNLINKGIKSFEEFYQKKTQKLLAKSKGIERLSNALAKSLGQKGKNVQPTYLPEPVPKWIKRRSIVEKKVKSL